jgi:hypothetical protein
MIKTDNYHGHRTGVSTFASHTSPSTDQSLQKSFHLSHADKIELKKISSPSENKKYATTQADTTMTKKLNTDNGLQGRTTRTTGYNSTYKKLAVQWLNEVQFFNQTFVQVDSFVLRNRQLLIAAKRYILSGFINSGTFPLMLTNRPGNDRHP